MIRRTLAASCTRTLCRGASRCPPIPTPSPCASCTATRAERVVVGVCVLDHTDLSVQNGAARPPSMMQSTTRQTRSNYMPQLQGPTDADAFRDLEKGVGRVYVDPLPGDEIAPATEDCWPSISAIKKVEAKDWTQTMVKRMANVSADEWHRIADLPGERRKAAMWEVNQHDLSVAAGRGTIIHWWGEDLLNGRPMRAIDPDVLAFEKIPAESLEIANQYKKALDDF